MAGASAVHKDNGGFADDGVDVWTQSDGVWGWGDACVHPMSVQASNIWMKTIERKKDFGLCIGMSELLKRDKPERHE